MQSDPYKQYLTQMQAQGRYRTLRTDPDVGDMSTWLDFSTNDYLNLSYDPEVISAAIVAAKVYGVGATGARLLSGNRLIIEQLESSIAQDKHTQAALVFSSGFQANATVLSSLLDQKILNEPPLVFFDKRNHASLYQGIFLCGAPLIRYSHLDMSSLEKNLKKHQHARGAKWIVTETLFGMEGDVVPLASIIALAQQYNASVFLDEAHAIGILGSRGYGLSTTVDFGNVPHIIMGTLSKAIGVSGGYVACSNTIKTFLLNHAPGVIYTTALSPMVVGAAQAAWKKIGECHDARTRLWALAETLKTTLYNKGFNIGHSSTHIVPVLLGDETRAMRVYEALRQEKILTSCVRPPTVPPGTARLRISLTAKHQEYDLHRLVEALCRYS